MGVYITLHDPPEMVQVTGEKLPPTGPDVPNVTTLPSTLLSYAATGTAVDLFATAIALMVSLLLTVIAPE